MVIVQRVIVIPLPYICRLYLHYAWRDAVVWEVRTFEYSVDFFRFNAIESYD